MSLIFFIQGKAIHGLGSTGLVSSGALLLMDLGTSEFYRLWEEAIWTQNDWLGSQGPHCKVSRFYFLLAKAVVLEKTLEGPLDCKEIQPVHSKGDQPRVFFGRNDAKAETPVLWPPHVKSWLIGNDPDAGRDWGQEEEGMTEDEMAGWHHQLDGHEFEWTPGDGDGQGGLECCDSWGRKESDTTEWLNWTELNWKLSWRLVTCIYEVSLTMRYFP